MPSVQFTYALRRFFPNLESLNVEATTVNEVLAKIDEQYPGIKSYILDDQGSLRKHVNIFVNGELIKDRQKLSDGTGENAEVYIMQALSGG